MRDAPNFSVRILTDADIPNIATRWEAQYSKSGEWTNGSAPLAATTLDGVDKEIGNQSWTHISCDACDVGQRKVVSFGRQYHDDEMNLCVNCCTIISALAKAISK